MMATQTEWDETKMGPEPHLRYASLDTCCIHHWERKKQHLIATVDTNTYLLDMRKFQMGTKCKCGNMLREEPYSNRVWSLKRDDKTERAINSAARKMRLRP